MLPIVLAVDPVFTAKFPGSIVLSPSMVKVYASISGASGPTVKLRTPSASFTSGCVPLMNSPLNTTDPASGARSRKVTCRSALISGERTGLAAIPARGAAVPAAGCCCAPLGQAQQSMQEIIVQGAGNSLIAMSLREMCLHHQASARQKNWSYLVGQPY